MSQRTALFTLAARYRLAAESTARLLQLAGLDAEPPGLARWLPRGVAILGAGLAGLGLVLWVAANWDALGRAAQLALLQGAVLAACAGALAVPAGRAALALLAMAAIGGLLAYVGQTYQTGADPWQLFAWWGLWSLPLALAVRSDALWVPWALVATSAAALWAQSHASASGFWLEPRPEDLGVHAWAWGASALIVAALAPPLRPLTGAGLWALRTAATLAVALIVFSALGGLFSEHTLAQYWIGLAALGLAALALGAWPAVYEIGVLSALALGLDTLLVAGLGRWLLHDYDFSRGEPTLLLLALGLIAAMLLAASVAVLLWLARRRSGAPT